jgi:hypothetical protein
MIVLLYLFSQFLLGIHSAVQDCQKNGGVCVAQQVTCRKGLIFNADITESCGTGVQLFFLFVLFCLMKFIICRRLQSRFGLKNFTNNFCINIKGAKCCPITSSCGRSGICVYQCSGGVDCFLASGRPVRLILNNIISMINKFCNFVVDFFKKIGMSSGPCRGFFIFVSIGLMFCFFDVVDVDS